MMEIHVPAIPQIRIRKSLKRRWVRRLALLSVVLSVLALVGYGIAVVVMLGIEPSLVYMPTKSGQEWSEKPSAEIQDVTLTTPDGQMNAWYLPAEKPDIALMICHGTGGNLSIRGQGLPEYRSRFHASVLVFDYPGYGKSDGEPTEAGCYNVANAAYDFLVSKKGFKPENVVIYGESLGGGVAVDLAARHEHRALVLVKTFASIPDMARERWSTWSSSPLVRNRFDSVAKIKNCKAPIFVAHGDRDRVIPLAEAKKLYEAAPTPKKFFLLQGSDHNDPLPPAFYDALAAFVRNSD